MRLFGKPMLFDKKAIEKASKAVLIRRAEARNHNTPVARAHRPAEKQSL